MPHCPKCEGSGLLEAIACDDEDMTLTVPCPACAATQQSPRYLAVYGAMVANLVHGLIDEDKDVDRARMRRIVELAHDVAKRSEDAQP